jgi:hypothetical protein
MRNHVFKSALIVAAAGLVMVDPAAAQSSANRDLKTMNFDLWCQEHAALPPERCDSRTPEDESAFETYQTALEHYDTPYRSAQYDQGRVNRDIMNDDPIDNPQKDTLGVQRQYPNISITDSPSK